MNLPNKLTVLRMALVPIFVVLMLCREIPQNFLWALLVFVAASLTDALDGSIARKNNLVTNFGKFMDPLADKILVMSAMLCFVELEAAPAAVVILIIAREFLVTSLRLIAAGQGTVIAADKWGKVKTVVQMIWVVFTILVLWIFQENLLGADQSMAILLYGLDYLLMWLSVALTVFSGANYVWKNRACINPFQ